jgi:DNA-directed RNA polymerase specialized sigma24 family protein
LSTAEARLVEGASLREAADAFGISIETMRTRCPPASEELRRSTD